MQIIALINQKGGVGKTTCAINMGAGLNKLKKRVLLILSSLNLSGAEIEFSGMAGRGFLF
jgi:MinD-like ATPase involved in chromosome partitioning or flagellar assembly